MANRLGKCGNSVSFCFLLLHFQYSDCSHEVKRCLLLWKITMINLDSVLKSRDITLLTKLHLVKAMAFLMVMCGYESWTIKKAEHQRNDAFKLWCCRWHLIVPCTASRSNQLILKEINTEYSLEGLILKLKLQYFGHPLRRADSLGNIRMLGKIETWRRRGWLRMRWLDHIVDSKDFCLSKLKEIVKDAASVLKGRVSC